MILKHRRRIRQSLFIIKTPLILSPNFNPQEFWRNTKLEFLFQGSPPSFSSLRYVLVIEQDEAKNISINRLRTDMYIQNK